MGHQFCRVISNGRQPPFALPVAERQSYHSETAAPEFGVYDDKMARYAEATERKMWREV